jgi:hypothetical protein
MVEFFLHAQRLEQRFMIGRGLDVCWRSDSGQTGVGLGNQDIGVGGSRWPQNRAT